MTETLRPIAFCFLRHGETDWNARGLSQGRTDIPLNDVGLAQAVAAGSMLTGRGIGSVFASSLSRARITGEIAAKALGLPIAIDPGLQEVSFGVQEGKSMADWFADWTNGLVTPAGGESFPELRTRSVAAVNRALDGAPLVLVVAHGAVFRALRSAMGVAVNIRTRNASPIWCSPPGPGETAWTLDYTLHHAD